MTDPAAPPLIFLDLTQRNLGYTSDPADTRPGDVAFVPLARLEVAEAEIARLTREREAAERTAELRALLPAVLDAAFENSRTVEGEFSCDPDNVRWLEERAAIDRVRAALAKLEGTQK